MNDETKVRGASGTPGGIELATRKHKKHKMFFCDSCAFLWPKQVASLVSQCDQWVDAGGAAGGDAGGEH